MVVVALLSVYLVESVYVVSVNLVVNCTTFLYLIWIPFFQGEELELRNLVLYDPDTPKLNAYTIHVLKMDDLDVDFLRWVLHGFDFAKYQWITPLFCKGFYNHSFYSDKDEVFPAHKLVC